jgi:hypothetical protein
VTICAQAYSIGALKSGTVRDRRSFFMNGPPDSSATLP